MVSPSLIGQSMKPILIVGIAIAALALLSWLTWPQPAHSEPVIKTVYVERVTPTLTPAQVIWLARLMDCESEIKDESINPNDLDNTPSWGILQFKPSTFNTFAAKYGITGELMSAESQVAIVTYWILHPGEIRWEQQFPWCVDKLGIPPVQ